MYGQHARKIIDWDAAAYLAEYGLAGDPLAVALAAVLTETPRDRWWNESLEAMRKNIEHNGIVSKLAAESGWTMELVLRARRAYQRHAYTDYDERLKSGMGYHAARATKKNTRPD